MNLFGPSLATPEDVQLHEALTALASRGHEIVLQVSARDGSTNTFTQRRIVVPASGADPRRQVVELLRLLAAQVERGR